MAVEPVEEGGDEQAVGMLGHGRTGLQVVEPLGHAVEHHRERRRATAVGDRPQLRPAERVALGDPDRVRVRDPSFCNLPSIPAMARGSLIADVIAIVASVDPVMGGVDR